MSTVAPQASSRWRRTWVELKAAAIPVIAFWAMTFLAFGLLFALYLVDEGQADGILIFGGIAVTTAVGIGLGQLAALARLRTWIIAAFAALVWSSLLLLALGPPPLPEEAMVAVILFIVLLPFFLLAGLWSLRVHMGLLATWAPLMYLTASILVISEKFTGSASNWFEGNKWAIWDLFSLPVLLLGAGFLVVYLAARERHRVQLWRFAKGGPELPRSDLEVRKGGRLGCSHVIAVLALTLVLAGGAALTAPFLWRSAPADDGDGPSHGQQQQQQSQPPPEPQDNQGCNQQSQQPDPQEGEEEGEEDQQTQEQVVEAVKQAGISLMTLILVVLLAIVGLLIFLPPMRRALLLRHLRKPLWPVPPTRQVLQAWRVVEIALADIGVHRRPGDSAVALARRAMADLPPDVDHADLLRCAEVTDRVLFGLGVSPGDPEHARRTAEMTYQAVWELMGEGARMRAVYRFV